jgi:hypothetical protein
MEAVDSGGSLRSPGAPGGRSGGRRRVRLPSGGNPTATRLLRNRRSCRWAHLNLRQAPDLFERCAPLGRCQPVARLLGDQSHADVVHRVLGVHLADSPVGRWAFQALCPIQSCQFLIQELVPPPERDLGRARQQMDVAIQRGVHGACCLGTSGENLEAPTASRPLRTTRRSPSGSARRPCFARRLRASARRRVTRPSLVRSESQRRAGWGEPAGGR